MRPAEGSLGTGSGRLGAIVDGLVGESRGKEVAGEAEAVFGKVLSSSFRIFGNNG